MIKMMSLEKALIDVYILGVFNLKGCVHSQPQICFQWKQYKESPQLSCCLFVFAYFFILIEAMNESALEKLRWEARKKKLERKVKAFKRE